VFCVCIKLIICLFCFVCVTCVWKCVCVCVIVCVICFHHLTHTNNNIQHIVVCVFEYVRHTSISEGVWRTYSNTHTTICCMLLFVCVKWWKQITHTITHTHTHFHTHVTQTKQNKQIMSLIQTQNTTYIQNYSKHRRASKHNNTTTYINVCVCMCVCVCVCGVCGVCVRDKYLMQTYKDSGRHINQNTQMHNDKQRKQTHIHKTHAIQTYKPYKQNNSTHTLKYNTCTHTKHTKQQHNDIYNIQHTQNTIQHTNITDIQTIQTYQHSWHHETMFQTRQQIQSIRQIHKLRTHTK
jgi:hypothetical protein